jgi:hypothetical protein
MVNDTFLRDHQAERENAYRDFFYNGVKLYNDAGCVANIAYNGSGFSQNIGLTWNSQYQLTSGERGRSL